MTLRTGPFGNTHGPVATPTTLWPRPWPCGKPPPHSTVISGQPGACLHFPGDTLHSVHTETHLGVIGKRATVWTVGRPPGKWRTTTAVGVEKPRRRHPWKKRLRRSSWGEQARPIQQHVVLLTPGSVTSRVCPYCPTEVLPLKFKY